MAITRPPRAFTSSTLLAIFWYTASLRAHQALAQPLDLRGAAQHALHELRQPRQLAHHLAPLQDRERPQTAHLERQQRERHDLARERLGRSDADLRAGVEVDPPVHLA